MKYSVSIDAYTMILIDADTYEDAVEKVCAMPFDEYKEDLENSVEIGNYVEED